MEERDLRLVAAKWEANLLPRERVPEIATELLQRGHDTPSLRVAAGLLPSELDEARELFGRALAELGHERHRNWRGRLLRGAIPTGPDVPGRRIRRYLQAVP